MAIVVILVTALLLLAIPIAGYSYLNQWIEHRNMTRLSCNDAGTASFKKFRKYFFSYQMKQVEVNRRAYSDPNYDTYVDAELGLIRFEGVGMLLRTPWDYMQFLHFMTQSTYYEGSKIQTFEGIMLEKGPQPLSLDDPDWLNSHKEESK